LTGVATPRAYPAAARDERSTAARVKRVYVALTSASTGDQPTENATIVAEEMYRWLRETEGFKGLLFLSREGTTLGLTFWESREIAERHLASRMQFRDRMLSSAGVEIGETVDYEVTFARLGPWAGEGKESGEGGI
jgi:hypothetical protein